MTITTAPIHGVKTLLRLFVQRAGPEERNLLAEVVAIAEKATVEAVLEHTRGNQLHAAQVLGLSRGKLAKLIRQHKITITERVVRVAGPSRFHGAGFSFDDGGVTR